MLKGAAPRPPPPLPRDALIYTFRGPDKRDHQRNPSTPTTSDEGGVDEDRHWANSARTGDWGMLQSPSQCSTFQHASRAVTAPPRLSCGRLCRAVGRPRRMGGRDRVTEKETLRPRACQMPLTAPSRSRTGSRSPCCASSMMRFATSCVAGSVRSTSLNSRSASSKAVVRTLISSGPKDCCFRSSLIGIDGTPQRTYLSPELRLVQSGTVPQRRGGGLAHPRVRDGTKVRRAEL